MPGSGPVPGHHHPDDHWQNAILTIRGSEWRSSGSRGRRLLPSRWRSLGLPSPNDDPEFRRLKNEGEYWNKGEYLFTWVNKTSDFFPYLANTFLSSDFHA